MNHHNRGISQNCSGSTPLNACRWSSESHRNRAFPRIVLAFDELVLGCAPPSAIAIGPFPRIVLALDGLALGCAPPLTITIGTFPGIVLAHRHAMPAAEAILTIPVKLAVHNCVVPDSCVN